MSACVLLQLIIPAPAEKMERERSLLGAIHPILRELAGKGVRNHMNCAWGAQLCGLEREKKTKHQEAQIGGQGYIGQI